MPRTSKSTIQQLAEAEGQLERWQTKVNALRRKRAHEIAHEHAAKCRRLGEIARSVSPDVTESQLRAALALLQAQAASKPAQVTDTLEPGPSEADWAAAAATGNAN